MYWRTFIELRGCRIFVESLNLIWKFDNEGFIDMKMVILLLIQRKNVCSSMVAIELQLRNFRKNFGLIWPIVSVVWNLHGLKIRVVNVCFPCFHLNYLYVWKSHVWKLTLFTMFNHISDEKKLLETYIFLSSKNSSES